MISSRGFQFFALMGPIFGVVSVIAASYLLTGQYRVTSIQTIIPEGRIEIWADRFYDNGVGVYYRVIHSGRVVIPMTFFTGGEYPDKKKFTAVCADTSSLVGIIESSRPRVVHIFHDFETGQSWPYSYSDEWRTTQERGDSLLERFQAENPSETFVLASEISPLEPR